MQSEDSPKGDESLPVRSRSYVKSSQVRAGEDWDLDLIFLDKGVDTSTENADCH